MPRGCYPSDVPLSLPDALALTCRGEVRAHSLAVELEELADALRKGEAPDTQLADALVGIARCLREVTRAPTVLVQALQDDLDRLADQIADEAARRAVRQLRSRLETPPEPGRR